MRCSYRHLLSTVTNLLETKRNSLRGECHVSHRAKKWELCFLDSTSCLHIFSTGGESFLLIMHVFKYFECAWGARILISIALFK